MNKDGVKIHNFEEIKEESFIHFSKIYSNEIKDNEEAQKEAIQAIPQMVCEEVNNELSKEIIEEEIKVSISGMESNYKAPGSYGFSTHFIKYVGISLKRIVVNDGLHLEEPKYGRCN